MSKERTIYRMCRKIDVNKKLARFFGKSSFLDKNQMKCLKSTHKSEIWRLSIKVEGHSHHIILKIIKSLSHTREKSIVEINMYRKAKRFLDHFMPKVYLTQSRVNGDEFWTFMEYVQPLKMRKVQFITRYLKTVIPALAKLHAHTYNRRFSRHREIFKPWLPVYSSAKMKESRNIINEKTKRYLEAAMNRPDLREIISPYYPLLYKLLLKGPIYFPELIIAGQSIIHHDLIPLNIGYSELSDNNDSHIKFIDWESAKFAPCWLDVVNIIHLFLNRNPEWKAHEEHIITSSANLYAQEMNKHGIKFKTKPLTLYKMACLQSILELNLYVLLRRAMKNRAPDVLLKEYLEKINIWGKQIGLH